MNRMDESLDALIEAVHAKACAAKLRAYTDPYTQDQVFTRFYLLDRGWCCQQGCRHCPYDEIHINMQQDFAKPDEKDEG